LLPAIILTAGCKDMKLDIQDSKDRLDVLEGATITTINEQITAINSSVTDLQSMDETLDGYIKSLETTAENLQKQINDANAEIAKVESELGEEITALEQSLLNELNSAKEAIQAELSAINKTLDDLKAADTALDKKIADLRTYVDTELASTKDWANATFSTLNQYEQTQTEISAIKASIEQINTDMAALETRLNGKIAADIKAAIDALRTELNADHASHIESAVNNVTTAYSAAISSAKSEITSAYTAAISSAISASESNLKTWVGKQLTQGYYNIVTLDGMLSALATRLDETDVDLQEQIDQQKEALLTAKNELTAAYKTAIEDAISENNGIINASIAAAVQKLEDKVQIEIDSITSSVNQLQGRIGLLESNFINRIQSFKFMPEYSDRVVPVSDFSRTISVDFLVSPARLAQSIVNEWNSDNKTITAYMRYTKEPVTRALEEAVPLVVSLVEASQSGYISVVLTESPENPFSAEFLSGESPAYIYLKISDGNIDVISELVDVRGFHKETEDLSASGSANVYIVTQCGSYTFDAVKGNSSEPVGDIASAEVLWETFGTDVTPSVGDIVKSVSYTEGKIKFLTAITYREGNAVIAVKDAEDNILWSWHIWLTDQPQAQVYYNGTGTMMDRNLGATSATPGDVGALGLLYQWGRKDPFLGSSSISSSTTAKSTITWPSVILSTSSIGTIEYATAHPTTFITYNTNNEDWQYNQDNTRWSTSDKTKSIYDPCPAGWRVPDSIWSTALGTSSWFMEKYDTTNEGMCFSGKLGSAATIWYPASGCLYGSNGGLFNVGHSGTYWSASTNSFRSLTLYCDSDGDVVPLERFSRAYGYSVRCISEID